MTINPRNRLTTESGQSQLASIYFPALDGLRFVAFLLVFVHHLPEGPHLVLRGLWIAGWVGVHIFLLLSAYLLAAILTKEFETNGLISLRRFYIRRALRIWPLYIAFGSFVIAWAAFNYKWSTDLTIRALGLVSFTDNIVSGFRGFSTFPWAAHIWTISLEEQFYLFLPLVLSRWLPRQRRLVFGILGIWIMFLLVRSIAVLRLTPHPWIWTSVFSGDALLLGTLLGVLNIRGPRGSGKQLMLLAGSVAMILACGIVPIARLGMHQAVVYTFLALGAGGLCISVLSVPWLSFLGNQPFRYLGKLSYGLYVFHLLGIALASEVSKSFRELSWIEFFIVALAATTLMASVSYQVLEKPFLLLKKRFEFVHTRPA